MSGPTREKLYATANLLAVLTIGYNLVEGGVSVWLGAADDALSLFGFGVDSFVEVISGIGVWHLVHRVRLNSGVTRDEFERRALRVTGWAFYALTAGLAVTAGLSLVQGHRPESTFWGVVVSLVSMSFMGLLIRSKTRVGKALDSSAILADAACSRACLYLSLVLLAASAGYELTGFGGFDAIGAVLIAGLAFREGREALQKARGLSCCCDGHCGGA